MRFKWAIVMLIFIFSAACQGVCVEDSYPDVHDPSDHPAPGKGTRQSVFGEKGLSTTFAFNGKKSQTPDDEANSEKTTQGEASLEKGKAS